MGLGAAEKILQGEFGGLKKIVPGSVVTLPDNDATIARWESINIGRYDHQLARNVGVGDGAVKFAGSILNGFADAGVVYVNLENETITTTAHEILHNNAAGDFRGKMGETFNEGTTELLAAKALNASGIKTPKTQTTYHEEVAVTKQLIDLLGEQTWKSAYFEGPDTLIANYESLKGAGGWATLKDLAEKRKWDEAKKAMATSLKSWWRRK